MKYGLFVVFFLAFACVANASLADDLKEFEALIPVTKIKLIAGKHLVFDKQFRDFKNFVGTQEFAQAWDTIMHNQEFHNVVKYVEESGADMIAHINAIAKLLKLAEYPKDIKSFDNVMPRSVMSFVDEVMGAMPKGDISNLMKQKMQSSPDFKKFHDYLTAPKFHEIVTIARNCQGLAATEALLRSKGLNIDRLLEIGKDVLTWTN